MPRREPILLPPQWELTPIDDLPKSGLYYLGCAYSHPDAELRRWRFRAVSRVAGRLATDVGLYTFCPIAHTHPISEEILSVVDQQDPDFWLRWDEVIIPHCDGLIVCALPGWQWSTGLAREIPQFAGKPLCFYDPQDWFTATEWEMLRAYNV
jgi:Domain of unknown function (DUF1937)